MLLTMAPTVAFAADNEGTQEHPWDISADGEGNSVTAYLQSNDNNTYTLNISGSGAMKDFTLSSSDGIWKSDAPWYSALTVDSETKHYPITAVEIGDNITHIGGAAFASLAIPEISFKQNVTSYGAYAYIACTAATTVDWTNFSLDTIPEGLLYGCTALRTFKNGDAVSADYTLMLPSTVTGIGTSAFYGCTSLIRADLTNLSKSVGLNAFMGCTALKQVTLPKTVDESCVGSYFGIGCFNTSAIETITLPENVTTISDDMFKRCGLLTDVKTTSSIQTIGQEAFFCDGQSVGKTVAPWSSFVGSNLDLSGVTTIGQSAFNSCSSLKSVIRLDSIRNLGERAFGDCSSVQVVDMSKAGNSITFASNAFTQLGNDSVIYVASNLDSLAGIYSRDMTALAVTNGGTFSDSATFTVGTLATPVKDNSVFGGWYTKDGTNGDWGNKVTSSTKLTAGATYYAMWNTAVLRGDCGAADNEDNVHWELTTNSDDTYTLTISGTGAMADYIGNITRNDATQPWRESQTGVAPSAISKVVVESGVTNIGKFACNGLNHVKEYDIGANVNTISQWALETSAAKVFNVNGNTNFKTDNNGVLFSKDGTTLIAYPGGSAEQDKYAVPSDVAAIADGAFVGCPIKKLTIGNNVKTKLPSWSFNGGVLEELDVNCPFGNSTFARITTLKKVTLDDSITEIPQMAFLECKGLQTVSIPSGLTKIGTQAFFGCSSLRNVTLPASLTEIGHQAFRDCDELTSITFPDSLEKVGNQAFTNCKGLKSLEFPDSLMEIGESAFSGCTELTYISYGSGIDDIGGNAFGGCTGVKVIDLHRATKIGERYDNGDHSDGSDPALTHACIKDVQYVKYYLRTVNQANSVKGNLEWGNNVAGGGNTTNTYYILTATDAVPDYTGKTVTPTRAGYTFGKWKEVTVSQGSPTEKIVYTDDNSWSLASPTVTVSPASANTYVGDSEVTLTAKVSKPVHGFNYSYQWYSNTSSSTEDGTVISEATRATYSPNITAAGTTYYYCVVTVKNGSDTAVATTEVIPVTAAKQAGSVMISNNKTTATYGDKPFTFTYTANKAATVTSSNPSVATVRDNNGTVTVTIVGAGTTEISVSFDADTNCSAASDKFTLTVNKATPAISISADPATMSGSGTVKLTVTKVPTDAVVSVTCDDTSVEVKNNNDGTYTVALPNTTKTYNFKAALAESANYTAADSTCTVSVTRRSSSSGSSSSNLTYSVTTLSKSENGKVSLDKSTAKKGDTVTVTVTPDAGYQLDKLTVTDKNGNVLKLTDKGDGKYSFTMPDGKVEIKAVFAKKVETSPFGDVSTDAYYYKAVQWAQEKGITDGISSDLFGPKQPCTRSQIVTFLWRAAGSPEPKGTAAGMTDVVPDSYYAKAVAWAVENGITTGTAEGTFSPDATCTRAQAVTFLARAQNAKATGKTAFSDVPAESYFADAVAWAQANGVTTGTSETTFSPDNDCTRAQIVTFLYRANQGT